MGCWIGLRQNFIEVYVSQTTESHFMLHDLIEHFLRKAVHFVLHHWEIVIEQIFDPLGIKLTEPIAFPNQLL